jgi:hypothetical protein
VRGRFSSFEEAAGIPQALGDAVAIDTISIISYMAIRNAPYEDISGYEDAATAIRSGREPSANVGIGVTRAGSISTKERYFAADVLQVQRALMIDAIDD